MRFSLKLFGGAGLEGETGPLTGPAVQRHRLALLATTHPGGLSRDKLLAYLWPERDTEHARNLLKQGLHALRRALGEEAILSAGEELRFNSRAVRCDVLEFEAPADAVYGTLRARLEQAGQPIGGNDLLIAAQVLALGYTLATDNEREFARIAELPLENWLR